MASSLHQKYQRMKNHKLNLAKGHEIITSNSLNYSSIEQEAVMQQNRMQYQMS
jgi:hypothetical protein